MRSAPAPSSAPASRRPADRARLAPVGRLLAAREAAETDEVEDVYLRPTGDEGTDRLLRDIRRDERSHSISLQLKDDQTNSRR